MICFIIVVYCYNVYTVFLFIEHISYFTFIALYVTEYLF